MLKKVFITFLLPAFSLCFLPLAAKEVVVKGKAVSFAGGEVRAYIYDELVTYTHKRIGEAEIGDDDSFSLQLELDRTEYLILKIEDKKTSFFIEPGKVYNTRLSYSDKYNEGNIYDKKLSLKFTYPTPDDLNQLIMKYNREYENFLAENYKKFAHKNTGKIITEFQKKTLDKYNKSENNYFKNFVRYSLASMEEALKKNEPAFYEKYMDNQPILFRNIEYMNFFNQLYEGKFKTYVISTDIGLELMGAINYYCNYDSVSAILRKKPILKNDTIRQLVVLKGLQSLYYNDKIRLKQPKMLKMLEIIKKDGICPETRAVATNIIGNLTHFKKGSKAPAFSLKNEKGDYIKLKDFKGKYLYLNFWASWNLPSLKEMKVMNKLHQKYGDVIEFVSISTDKSRSDMEKVLSKNNYKWTFLHIGNNKEVIEEYEANIIPKYFLIDPEGRFISAPAERPTGAIEKKLYNISRQR